MIGEFDGRVQYTETFGEDPRTVLWREKRREDRLRRAGWSVVRWIWADLARPSVLAALLLDALGTRRTQ